MANGISLYQSYPEIRKSKELLRRITHLIPAQSQTLAKGPGQFVKGVAPNFAERGRGSHIWDVDGNEYIDYIMAVGPVSLGYAYPAVDQAIRRQLEYGITFSLVHPMEVEVAELLHEVIPNAEMVRYSKTGADAVSAAVRLARAFTGRKKILCCGYHGWHDWYIGTTDRSNGIPTEVRELTYTFEYNDIEGVERSLDKDVAAVVLEPTVFEEPNNNFLHRLKEVCEMNGTVLIFDEMWTGFRLALGGAQEYFGVKADIACFSKAVANGMPLSIITGRKDILQLIEKDVFFFTTFGGEALSLAAAKATIVEIREKNVPAYLFRQGKKLKDGYNAIARSLGMEYTTCIGFDVRTMITFSPSAGDPLLMKSLLQQELIKRGILWGGFHTISYSHSDEDVSYTLSAYREALIILRKAIAERSLSQMLRGAPVESSFRRVNNFNMKPVSTK